MPKKAPKNAFYFYMMDFKEAQRKNGINYGKMNEVAEAAGPSWKEAPPEIRKKYEAIAKKEKMRNNGLETKLTNTGVPLSEIERQAKELEDAQKAELTDIRNMINTKTFNNTIIDEDFYIMDVNYYCVVGCSHLIGESTILRFNLKNGIHETYHEIVNPGYIPTGFASDVKLSCAELGLDAPDDSRERSNYMQILANMIDYLKQKDRKAKHLPPIFAMPDKILPIQDFIQQMCRVAGEDDSIFRVYRLDTMFFTLINSIRTGDDEGFPKESLALQQLKKDLFKYTPDMGCIHHEQSDKAIECTMSRTKRQAYIILDSCCPVAGVELVPGKHLPFEYDMKSILIYKEQKRGRTAPTVAGRMDMSACSMISDSFNESLSLNSTTDSSKKDAPLRMPKANYSQSIFTVPELTDRQFPQLVPNGMGRGRRTADRLDKNIFHQ